MKNKGTRYDHEFKRMIVDLYNTKEHTYASLQSKYDIPASTIQSWVKQFTPIQIDIDAMSPAEIKAFRKENPACLRQYLYYKIVSY